MSYCNYKAKDKYIMGHGSFIHIYMKQAFMLVDIKQKVGNIGLLAERTEKCEDEKG